MLQTKDVKAEPQAGAAPVVGIVLAANDSGILGGTATVPVLAGTSTALYPACYNLYFQVLPILPHFSPQGVRIEALLLLRSPADRRPRGIPLLQQILLLFLSLLSP